MVLAPRVRETMGPSSFRDATVARKMPDRNGLRNSSLRSIGEGASAMLR